MSLHKRSLAIAIAALVSSLIVLCSPGLLLSFLAGFTLVCVLPGLTLTHLLRERLGPLDAIEEIILSVGIGYVLLILVALALDYLPLRWSRGNILVAFNLLILVLLALRLWTHRQGERPTPIPRSALYALLLTAAMAAVLRFPALGYSEFVGDEAKVLLWASEVVQGRGDVIFLYRKGPAEILVSAVFYALQGRTNELIARLPFTTANFIAILTIFQLGRSMFSLRVGLAAGLLAGLEGLFVGLARVVQYQSLVILLGCLSVWLFYRFCRGSVQAWPFLGAITFATGFLCHWDMVFLAPVVVYFTLEALRRHREAISAHLAWLIAGVLLGITLLASFYLPFFINPHFTQTSEYLSKRVRAYRFPYFHLGEFFDYGTTYNSTYYAVVMSLAILLEMAAVTRRSLTDTRLSTPMRVAVLAIVPGGLFLWIGVEHPGRVALLACASLIFTFVLLSSLRVETKGLCLWFLACVICYTFIIKSPKLHIYNFCSATSLLGGSALVRSLSGLRRPGPRRMATAGFALMYVLFANYDRMVFLQTDPEYRSTYPAHRHPAYWTPYGDTLPQLTAFGFPYAAGWKVVGSLFQRGILEGDYDSNDKAMVTQWYTRGEVRCKLEPHYYFLADNVPDEQPVPLNTIAEEYDLIGVISVGGSPKLRMYERSPAIPGEAGHYLLDDWNASFDSDVSGPSLFTGVPQVDPQASIPHPTDYRFGDHLRVLGYGLERSQFQPGAHVTLTLYWQMLEPLASGHRIFVHLGQGEDRWAQRDVHPGCGLLSEDDWIPGKVVADRYSFVIDPATPPGWYPMQVGMYRVEATFEERLKVPIFDSHDNPIARDDVFLTKLQVGEPDIEEEIQSPVEYGLGDGIVLVGYALAETEITPGSTLQLTLYWQAREETAVSYTVFTHLVDEAGRIRGQWDGIPDGGRNPTDEWVSGEIIVDRYEIPVSPNAAPGQHMLRIGMYDIITGERLQARDAEGNLLGGGHIPLSPIGIRSD